jgi:hypothetical protein
MEAQTGLVLLALTLFAAKHCVADFVLQTDWMFRGKGIYGHPGGLAHAGLHMLASLPALALLAWGLGLTPAPALAAIGILTLAEGIVHYHIDWSKEALARHLDATPDTRRFWVLIGADQLLHTLTYIALTATKLSFA